MLRRWILSIVLSAVALFITSMLFESFHLDGFGAAVLASLILSIVNTFLKPIMVFFTLPITVLTLGLFLFVINAATLMITQSFMGDSFVIDGFATAMIAAVIISLLNVFLNRLVKDAVR